MSKLATIICDASWAHNGTRAAGWAGFVACNNQKRYYGDSFHTQPINTTICEMMAVVNTLFKGIKEGIIPRDCKVIVQTDCMPAIDRFQRKYDLTEKVKSDYVLQYRTQANEVHNLFQRMLREHLLTVEWRHVRGHTGIADNRSIVQAKVDKKARYHMAVQSDQRSKRKTDGNSQAAQND